VKGVRIRGVPLDMSRIHPQCGNPSDQSVADFVLRQEPDDEDDEEDEEEDEEDGTKDDDDDPDDNGYSE
jgi:hypothetical protein